MKHNSGFAEGFSPADFAQGALVNAYLLNAALDVGPQAAGMHTAEKVIAEEPTDELVRGILAAIMASTSPMLGPGDLVVFGGEVPDPEGADYAQTIISGLYGNDRMTWLSVLAVDELFWRAFPYFLVAVVGAVMFYADTDGTEMPPGIMVFPKPEDES